jgi:hypothetical protein
MQMAENLKEKNPNAIIINKKKKLYAVKCI